MDILITKQALYLLSYDGKHWLSILHLAGHGAFTLTPTPRNRTSLDAHQCLLGVFRRSRPRPYQYRATSKIGTA